MTTPRIGSVGYLNTVPLTRGIEDQVFFTTPAELARLLQARTLDAALVSITEPLLRDGYDLLDGAAIASRGPVRSVVLAHRAPLEQLREVHCHTASLTSVNLLKVLLAGRGLRPVFVPMPDAAKAAQHEAALLIGDPALDFQLQPGAHHIWDLGGAWWDLTGLPFVYAAWALRRGAYDAGLCARLRAARDRGMAELPAIHRERKEYTLEFRRAYLGGCIRYELGAEEKRGLEHFGALLERHGLGPVHAPRFVS